MRRQLVEFGRMITELGHLTRRVRLARPILRQITRKGFE